jgi:ribosomal protein S14
MGQKNPSTWEAAIYSIEVKCQVFPELWKEKVKKLMGELNHNLTAVVLSQNHPATEIVRDCDECGQKTLFVSEEGCNCKTCEYQDICPALLTDSDWYCPKCGHPTGIISEDTMRCANSSFVDGHSYPEL